MSYQLPPLQDDEDFERLVRDILRRVYDDPGIERFGRKGQAQSGIDGFSPADPTVTFQTKLKDTRHEPDHRLRDVLLKEIEEELNKTDSLPKTVSRFIFASTFKNDTELQNRAVALSSDTLTVEYWGWDTISDRIWEYAEQLIPAYYPEIPVRPIHGFKQISARLIDNARITDQAELQRLALDYYRINDRSDVVFQIVCNDVDVRNSRVMEEVYRRLETISLTATLWLIGEGGSGKTTILHRLAVELARRGDNVFTLNLEAQIDGADIEAILSILKFCSPAEQTVLCIDNPAADEVTLERILREIPDYADNVQIVLAERAYRYYTLERTGVLTYLHGEDEIEPVRVRNARGQREEVYNKLFDLLNIDHADRGPLLDVVRNEQLVYVNATYSILLELKKKRRIDFDFDWDDYRKATTDLSAFREGYKYIALFYLFGVRTPFQTFSRICGADDAQQKLFLERFRGQVNEPIIVDEWRDESARKITHLRTKHEIVSDIFFQEHPTINKEELLIDWCEQVDFADPQEVQALINIFGLKKNYLTEGSSINFEKLIDFLMNSYIKDRVAISAKLTGTLNLARFWILMLREKVDAAVKVLQSFLRTAHDNVHCRTELAKVYQRQGKLEDAESVLLTLLQIEQDSIRGRTELAKVYRAQHRFNDAEVVLQRVLDGKPYDIQATTELAKVYQGQGKLSEAESLLVEVLRRKPRDLNSRTELAKLYQRQSKYREAEEILLALLKLDTNNSQARTELAKTYQRQGKLEQAELLLLKVLERKPRDLNSRTELAKIYQRQGKLAEAEKLLLESRAIDDKQLHSRTELAKIYQRQGKLAEAEKLLLESLAIDDKQFHPRTELAKIYQRQGKLAEAEKLLFESLAIDDKQLHPRTELAKIYQRQGKLGEAEEVLMELLKLEPDDLQARTELAKIYQRQGKFAEAVQRLEEYITLDPNGLHPRTELAKIYRRQGRFGEAVLKAEEVLALDPLNDFAMSELLGTWDRVGEKEKCKQRFLAFIEQPGYKFSRYSQAPVFRFFQCCRRFGMRDEAKVVYERFRSQLDDRNLDFYESTFLK